MRVGDHGQDVPVPGGVRAAAEQISDRLDRLGILMAVAGAMATPAATSPLLNGRGGLYLEDCDVARISVPEQPMG